MRAKFHIFEQLVSENKQDLKQDEEQLNWLERRLESKQTKLLEMKQEQRLHDHIE